MRAEGRPEDLAAEVPAAVLRVDPTQVIDRLQTMESQVHEAYAAPRTIASLVGGLSLAALLLATVGIAFGLAGGVALRRAIASLLYDSGRGDFGAFAVAALVLFVVALLAADGPARRASEVDPAVALRAEF